MIAASSSDSGNTIFESTNSILVEVTAVPSKAEPPTATMLLHLMRERIKYYGAPLPDNYVPPPGIDIDALLKQVPWPPPEAA
jgi:hypothetical protein